MLLPLAHAPPSHALTPQLLEDDILPALEKLRKERGEYMKWMSANDKLERLKRFCLAHEYSRADAARAEAAGGTDTLRQQARAGARDPHCWTTWDGQTILCRSPAGSLWA